MRMILAAAASALLFTVPAAHAATIMPDLVGKGLDTAYAQFSQDTKITTIDATGAGRIVLMPSNWKVCAHDPRAGAFLFPGAIVTFVVVKNEEKCASA
ncbi:hypothetical protein Lesp02_48820 [Lentzea sp. NBRC 105346]|uniref:PASTA domain-containing protein n=1 Tax=Lentzea sp. NBRC 105346 TaxID=3032205 RepID=UPI0024A41017|nr:PASTA domain-containing protein [Lentzea sp. NBRC 105346]GLZ32694.1 hypothetical protein Lesp02_48820 [Lentzea sp. NBRC 105346]